MNRSSANCDPQIVEALRAPNSGLAGCLCRFAGLDILAGDLGGLGNCASGAVSLSITGENMWYKAVNFPEGVNFDPEVLSLGVGNGRGFDFTTGPTSKRYSATLNLTF